MFYSQTFLARKGPLGTVWCAAHLQHKLRKSHYTATDIPSTVDRIMFPDVPIALRLSSHLLLGVVRIYSKKVDYLYQDCNLVLVTLKDAFVCTDVNLPPNATQAQFNAVTLPETYQLDALDIDDVWSDEAFRDNHIQNQEEITLTDEFENPSMRGYVAITFDDDIMQDLSHLEQPQQGPVPMEEEGAQVPENDGTGDQGTSGSNASAGPPVVGDGTGEPATGNADAPDNTMNVDNSPLDIEEIEVMRDTVAEPNAMLSELLDQQNTGVAASPRGLSEPQIIRDKETPTLSEENPRVQSPSPLFQAFSSASRGMTDPFQLNPTPVNNTPALELQPTPQAEKPEPKRRKRKQFFDTATVLTNEHMKKRLQDRSDLVKKRRKIPCSSSDAWRLNNKKIKEQIFMQPSISGLCSNLVSLSAEGFISSNPNLILSDEDHERNETTASVLPDDPDHDTRGNYAPEIAEHPREEAHEDTSEQILDPVEQLRDESHNPGPSIIADLFPSPPRAAATPHHMHTPLSAGTALRSMQALGNSPGTLGNSPGTVDSGRRTPLRNLELDSYSKDTRRSYSPAFMNSAEDELAFLEVDSYNPTDSQQASQENTMLSARTRAVAQYLRGQSPLSSSPNDDRHGDRALTLNSILQGRSRKMAARMFYETLVLKSYGLIDVEQEEPNATDKVYGDIKLSLTSKVSKGQF